MRRTDHSNQLGNCRGKFLTYPHSRSIHKKYKQEIETTYTVSTSHNSINCSFSKRVLIFPAWLRYCNNIDSSRLITTYYYFSISSRFNQYTRQTVNSPEQQEPAVFQFQRRVVVSSIRRRSSIRFFVEHGVINNDPEPFFFSSSKLMCLSVGPSDGIFLYS